MKQCVMYTLDDDNYLRKILSITTSEHIAKSLMWDYRKCLEKFKDLEVFKMNFDIDESYLEQRNAYLKSDTWETFKDDDYLELLVNLNITDATMYEMLRDEDILDYWKLDDTPQ